MATLKSAIKLTVILLILFEISRVARASEKQTADWTQTIREIRTASVLCERKVFNDTGNKPRDVKKHQLRRQTGSLFFRVLHDYGDATNYVNSRMLAAGHWGETRWAVQVNDLFLSNETEKNHATNSMVWFFGDLAQEFANEVFCWGLRNLDPASLKATSPNHFRGSLRQSGWEINGELLEFSEIGLPTKLVYILSGPTGPYQTNEVQYDFAPHAEMPCLPTEIRSFLILGDRRIAHVFIHIEEAAFSEGLLPEDQFLPVLFSSAKPFRFELVTTEKGLFQRNGDMLVKVPDSSSAKPASNKMRYLYFLLVFVAGGTLMLVLRRRFQTTSKKS